MAGLTGQSSSPDAGVVGVNDCPPPGGNGGWFESAEGEGVRGHSKNRNHGGVVGTNSAGGDAGFFDGSVTVTGRLHVSADVVVKGDLILEGCDYAESLAVADLTVTAGMVVVIDSSGRVRPCSEEYDTRVAGIVSGAGGVKPALLLDRQDGGAPIALAGKLWVLADAAAGPIRCGDMLTTSSNPGHARGVVDRHRAFGAVIGKALTELTTGTGLVRALVSAT